MEKGFNMREHTKYQELDEANNDILKFHPVRWETKELMMVEEKVIKVRMEVNGNLRGKNEK
jgi:hypothetical protein